MFLLMKEDDILFLHKVMDGAVDRSYGINVAKLANLPMEVIEEANKLLIQYEGGNGEKKRVKQFELDITTEEPDELRDFLRNVNPLEVSPMEALRILDEIKKMV